MKRLSILIPSKCEPRIVDMLYAVESRYSWAEVIVAQDRDGRGKGWALRKALEYAKGDIICFIDGDLDIHPKMFARLMPFIEDYDIVVGKKQIRGILSRRILSRFSRLFIQFLFGLGIDTQTGIKMFRREALPTWSEDGYMFDLEILAKARKNGNSIIEVPVEANIERKMRGSSVLRCLLSAIRIRLCLL